MRILVILVIVGLSLASLEEEYSEDTTRCVETAKTKHLDNPNAGLDHFVNCLLAQLQQVEKSHITHAMVSPCRNTEKEKLNETLPSLI